MWVSRPSGGVADRARSIAAAAAVGRRSWVVVPLKITIPSCCWGLRWAANARAAANAAVIGLPFMLRLVSITRMTPSARPLAALAGRTDGLATGFPFSRTCTLEGLIFFADGSERTYCRFGKASAPAGVIVAPAA